MYIPNKVYNIDSQKMIYYKKENKFITQNEVIKDIIKVVDMEDYLFSYTSYYPLSPSAYSKKTDRKYSLVIVALLFGSWNNAFECAKAYCQNKLDNLDKKTLVARKTAYVLKHMPIHRYFDPIQTCSNYTDLSKNETLILFGSNNNFLKSLSKELKRIVVENTLEQKQLINDIESVYYFNLPKCYTLKYYLNHSMYNYLTFLIYFYSWENAIKSTSIYEKVEIIPTKQFVFDELIKVINSKKEFDIQKINFLYYTDLTMEDFEHLFGTYKNCLTSLKNTCLKMLILMKKLLYY